MATLTGKTNMVGWNAGCAETCLSGAGGAGRKPTAEMQQGAVLRPRYPEHEGGASRPEAIEHARQIRQGERVHPC